MKINDRGYRAQVALEFTIAFICTMLFLIGTVQLFVWFGSNIVNRNRAYENSRRTAKEIPCFNCFPDAGEYKKEYQLIIPKEDFYKPSKLDIIFKK